MEDMEVSLEHAEKIEVSDKETEKKQNIPLPKKMYFSKAAESRCHAAWNLL